MSELTLLSDYEVHAEGVYKRNLYLTGSLDYFVSERWKGWYKGRILIGISRYKEGNKRTLVFDGARVSGWNFKKNDRDSCCYKI